MALLGDQSRKKGRSSQIIDSDHDMASTGSFPLKTTQASGHASGAWSSPLSIVLTFNNSLARQVFGLMIRRNLCSCVNSQSEFRCRRGAAALGIASGWWIRPGAGSLGDVRWARLAGPRCVSEYGKPSRISSRSRIDLGSSVPSHCVADLNGI